MCLGKRELNLLVSTLNQSPMKIKSLLQNPSFIREEIPENFGEEDYLVNTNSQPNKSITPLPQHLINCIYSAKPRKKSWSYLPIISLIDKNEHDGKMDRDAKPNDSFEESTVKMVRRKSCECSECGGVSKYEAMTVNIGLTSQRTELSKKPAQQADNKTVQKKSRLPPRANQQPLQSQGHAEESMTRKNRARLHSFGNRKQSHENVTNETSLPAKMSLNKSLQRTLRELDEKEDMDSPRKSAVPKLDYYDNRKSAEKKSGASSKGRLDSFDETEVLEFEKKISINLQPTQQTAQLQSTARGVHGAILDSRTSRTDQKKELAKLSKIKFEKGQINAIQSARLPRGEASNSPLNHKIFEKGSRSVRRDPSKSQNTTLNASTLTKTPGIRLDKKRNSVEALPMQNELQITRNDEIHKIYAVPGAELGFVKREHLLVFDQAARKSMHRHVAKSADVSQENIRNESVALPKLNSNEDNKLMINTKVIFDRVHANGISLLFDPKVRERVKSSKHFTVRALDPAIDAYAQRIIARSTRHVQSLEKLPRGQSHPNPSK